MSTIDLWADGFPHATKEGYQLGCRGSACPGVLDYGFSCTRAQERYSGDYQYRKMVDAGLGPKEIREAEREAVLVADQEKKLASARKRASVKKPAAVTVKATEQTPAAPDKARGGHGTPTGYKNGCRDPETCPGHPETGVSCSEVKSIANRRQAEARKVRVAAGLVVAPRKLVTKASATEVESAGFTVTPADAALRIDQTENGGVLVDLTGVKGEITLRLEFAAYGLASVRLGTEARVPL